MLVQVVDHLEAVEGVVVDEGSPLGIRRSLLFVAAAPKLRLINDRYLLVGREGFLGGCEHGVALLPIHSSLVFARIVLEDTLRLYLPPLSPPCRSPHSLFLTLSRLLGFQGFLLIYESLWPILIIVLGDCINLIQPHRLILLVLQQMCALLDGVV